MSPVLGTVGIAVPVLVLLVLLLSLVILALGALSMRMHNARLDEWAAEDSTDATLDDETLRTDGEVTAQSRLTHEGDGVD